MAAEVLSTSIFKNDISSLAFCPFCSNFVTPSKGSFDQDLSSVCGTRRKSSSTNIILCYLCSSVESVNGILIGSLLLKYSVLKYTNLIIKIAVQKRKLKKVLIT